MARSYGDYGNAVKVKDSKTGKIFLFAHLKSFAVKVGQTVSRTSKIGIMGNTGRSTGPHLHIEMRTANDKYGEVEDIASYMGIPNKVGSYNSANYQIDDKPDISYEVHIQDLDWQEPKENGEIAGTTEQALRIEAIKIFADIPIKYRVHVEGIGDMPWVSNGEVAGTTRKSLRIECIEIKADREIKATAHVQDIGWLTSVVGKEISIGTKGRALRLEALTLEFV